MKSWYTYVKLYLVALLSTISLLPGNSQTQISGVVNKYASVTSVDNINKDRVIVDVPSYFVPGDTILLIQMKGAVIDTVNTPNLITSMNGTGKYEYIQVSTVNYGTGLIVFTSKFLNNYDSGEAIQVVKVPSYVKAKVTGTITCQPWDGTKGGVISFFVLDTLELAADIDASGKGFLGADPVQYTGTCAFGIRYYTSAVAGKKGESVVGKYFNKPYGKGFFGNGGGGGNGLYAGGGGGGGVGQGSRGNKMSCADPTNKTNGEPGVGITDFFNGIDFDHKDRIFFGGGGGSGTFPLGSTSVKGGNGGGIIFIITRYLKNTNNKILRANGEDVTTLSTNPAGTGGGGGGGNVLLSAEKFIGTIYAEVKGGYGGGNNGTYCWGQGGGGGGGLVWFSDPTPNSLDTLGGQKGDYKFGACVQSAQASSGYSLTGLNPVLNGFLFNMIGEPHTICYGQPSKTMIGTTPRGGNGVYNYQWQVKKYNVSNWTTIAGANTQNYTAPYLTDTSYFRRIVTTTKKNANGIDVLLTDTSKALLVSVIPKINNNTITPANAELCSGQSPIVLTGGTATRQGDPAPTYFWKTNKPRTAWIDGTLPNTNKNYTQTLNTAVSKSDTTYYHRIVSSSICKDTANAMIIVHPLIGNDSVWVKLPIWKSQEICFNAAPKQIAGSLPSGGKSGKYVYRWEKSIDNKNWSIEKDSASVNINLNPSALIQTTYFRRITYSGLYGVCRDTASTFQIKVWPKITNNSISSSQAVICEETSPLPFTNSTPLGGNGTFTYQWIKSLNNSIPWDSVSTSSELGKYPDNKLLSAISFKRVVRSGLYDCCKDSSNSVSFTIQPKFKNDLISSDTTLCKNQMPNLLGPRKGAILNGGKKPYKYQWFQRLNNSKTWSPALTDSIFQPTVLTDTSYFRRIVNSSDDVCKDTAIMIVRVLPLIKNNILHGNNAVCNDSTLAQINGDASLDGGDKNYKYAWDYKPQGGSWKTTTVNTSYFPAGVLPSVIDSTVTIFRRTVFSGLHDCCVDTSSSGRLDVKTFARPISGGLIKDTSIVFDFIYKLVAPKPKLGKGLWKLVNYDIQPEVLTDTTAKATFPNPDLSYKIHWIITTNAACPSKIDSFTITIKDIGRYNGFSPNNDNKNDYFIVKGLQNLDETNGDFWSLKILNRWGGLVFTTDINSNRLKNLKDTSPYTELGLPVWDGKNQSNESVAEDTYFYVLTVFKKDDKLREYKGFVVMKH